jgi:hypothetical protein
MQPQNLLLETGATRVAELELDGLALCNFNRKAGWWEVAFLKETRPDSENPHIFGIRIEEKDQTHQTVGEPFEVPAADLQTVRRLELRVQNGSNDHYTEFANGYFGSASFDRGPGDHQRDFGWVIDFVGPELSEQHGGFKGLKVPRTYEAILLKVPHTLFYTKVVTDHPMLLLEVGGKDMHKAEVFGHTNELVGAHVLATTPGDITLIGTDLAGVGKIDKTLPYREGHYYRIEFKNMEARRRKIVSDIVKNKEPKKKPKVSDYKDGDFDVYYEVIDVEKSKRYNLWGPDRTVTRGKLGDCNIVRLGSAAGDQTLEDLLG